MAESTNERESPSSTLSRGDLLRRGGAAAFAVSMFGGLSDRALGFYGPLKFAHKQLAGDLRIMTWAHFVPVVRPVARQHVRQAVGRGERRRGQGRPHQQRPALQHRGLGSRRSERSRPLLVHLPAIAFQKQAMPVTDLVQEVRRSSGRWHALPGRRPTTRRRSSSTASRRRTRPTRFSIGRASSKRPG